MTITFISTIELRTSLGAIIGTPYILTDVCQIRGSKLRRRCISTFSRRLLRNNLPYPCMYLRSREKNQYFHNFPFTYAFPFLNPSLLPTLRSLGYRPYC